jgi:hypothetical protein
MTHTSRGRRANGPDSEWLDLMVKNLKDELQRQLARVRDSGENEKSDARSRAADARTLAVLQNTLEKLGRLEQQRAVVRETKVSTHEQGARTALERRLDKLLDGGAAPDAAGES